MAVIDIREFGGEMPSTSPRNLPGNTGQAAMNLLNSSNEFVPLNGPLVVATTETVVNPGAAVPNPKSLFRTAYLADGSPNLSLTGGWLAGAEEANVVRGQINGSVAERTYYTGTAGARKFAWQGGGLVDRPMGVPAPVAAPAAAHVVVDEFRTSELAEADKDSRGLIAGAIRAGLTTGLAGCEIAFSAPSPSTFGWLDVPGNPARRYLRVPYVDGAIKQGFEFLLGPQFGGSKITDGATDYWQANWGVAGSTWQVDAPVMKSALLALQDPAIAGTPLLSEADADAAVAKAQAHFSTAAPARAELIAQSVERCNAVQRALQSVQDGSLSGSFYAGAAYKTALTSLIGDVTLEGTVTNAIMGIVYVMVGNTAWGEPGNVNESILVPTRYWQPDYLMYGGFTKAEGLGLIRADLVECIKTNADGTKRFDYLRMTTYLLAEFTTIAELRSTASKNHYLPKIAGWVTELLAPMKAFFEPQAQISLSAGLVGGGNSLGVSFGALIDQAGALLTQITTEYLAAREAVGELARTVYDDPDVTARSRQSAAAVVPIIDTRFYVATYVTDWDEESAPSPVSTMVEVDQNDQVVVGVGAPPPEYPYINRYRLYRSNVGSETAAFQFLHEGEIAARTFTDTKTAAELGEVCPSLTWLPPPPTLSGLVGMPNGILVGHFGNTVAFSEPYVPYAWPVEYQITTETTIVGLGVFGQTVFVGTTGSPYYISGSDSASMSAIKLESSQACASRRSIVALDGGVMYASPDGLCLADPSGVKLVSRGMWTHKDWQVLQPETIFAASHEGAYVFAANNGSRVGILGDGKLTEVPLDELLVSALYSDKLTGTLCSASGSYITASFGGPFRRIGRWRSKTFTLPAHQPMAWAKVYGEQTAEFPVTLRWYGDNSLRHTATFTNTDPQRLPPGRWLEQEIEIESQARVTRVILASTSDELRAA